MAWTFVRPVDPSVLDGRPLLDIGTGDAQTLLALTANAGLRVGVDRSSDALRAARRSGLEVTVAATARDLPFAPASFLTVVAADVFHHADDVELRSMVSEIRRTLADRGRLVAWWYERPGRGGLGEPRFPRRYADVAEFVRQAGFAEVVPLSLELGLKPSPPTVGVLAEG